jgi:hypothetical protein
MTTQLIADAIVAEWFRNAVVIGIPIHKSSIAIANARCQRRGISVRRTTREYTK